MSTLTNDTLASDLISPFQEILNSKSSDASTDPVAPAASASPQALPRVRAIDYLRSSPFFLVHLAALICVFLVPFKWQYVAFAVAMFYARMFAITGGYHRYFSHRSYKTSRVMQFLIALLGTTSAQKGVLWWAANHRLHHKYSDQPADIHSPLQRGFWWSHAGWIISNAHEETRWDQIPDLAKYPELRWLNKWHVLPPIALGVGIYLLCGFPAFVWGFLISTVALWHCTFFINSMAHVWGTRRYQSTDTSRNNFLLSILTMGEGWHNNHHTYMSSTRQGFFWYEIDLTYYIIKGMSLVGLTSNLRQPPLALLDAKRIKPKKQKRAAA
ncbi:MAG: acyl-CoA desaturase [Oligoflexia bacterium]|nr:acyl-CoA desaturase [Oligoflexia bacterium]